MNASETQATSKKAPIRTARLWSGLFGILALIAFWVNIASTSDQGKRKLSLSWPRWLLSKASDRIERRIVVHLLVPRGLAAMIVGISLALAGLLLQGVTQNPLAEPYLLGVSGGAGFFVVLLHALNWIPIGDIWMLPCAAFLGAQMATFFVLWLAKGPQGRLTVLRLVLAGVMVNAFCIALINFILTRFDPLRLRVTTLWLTGGFGFVTYPQLLMGGMLATGAWILLRATAHGFNAFALGVDQTAAVGIDSDRYLMLASILSSMLTGVAVSLSGLLGYVGLIVPHLARTLARGVSFKNTMSLAACLGALLLQLADMAARQIFAPEELPVGVLMALLGCPVLLVLLRSELGNAKQE